MQRLMLELTRALPVMAAFLAGGSIAMGQALVGGGASYARYDFRDPGAVGIERLSLLTVPWAARVPLSRGVAVQLGGNYAIGQLVRADGGQAEIAGLTDTDVRLFVSFRQNRVLLSAGYTLPTGHSSHTAEESEVAGAIASDLLPFRVSNWGGGGGPRADAAFTLPIGAVAAALTIGYGYMSDFEPLEGDERAYRPGNEFALGVTLAADVGRTGRVSLQGAMRSYSDDQLAAQNLYRSGNRYQALASYAFAAGRTASGVTYAGVQHREKGTVLLNDLASLGEPASQDLLLGGLGFRLPRGRAVLLPGLDGRVFRSADGVGQGYSLGIGTSAELPVGAVRLVPLLRLRLGHLIVRDGTESGFYGFEGALTIRLGGS